jgi:hypothetical protein
MDQTTKIEKDVNIVAYYFHNRGPRLRCFPRVMEWGARRINFTQTGLMHPTKKGQRTIHVFDMTDGTADYRLEFDAQNLNWTLVSIADANLSNHNAQIVPPAAAS